MATATGPGQGGGISRRAFLRTGSLIGGAAVVGACSTEEPTVPAEMDVSAPQRPPLPPDLRPVGGVHEFFTRPEAVTVDAVIARIIPGDEEDPGAREAGVLTYIDGKLARFDAFAEPTYVLGPFAEGYEGDARPADPAVVPVPEEQLYRYGHQSELLPQQLYRAGLEGLDRYSRRRFGAPFAELEEGQQDTVLQVLDAVQQRSEGSLREGGGSPGGGGPGAAPPQRELDAAEEEFGETDPGSFFDMVRGDTIEGFFADPVYGGNRGLVGWILIGYPGPQRSYSPREMKAGTRRRPQSLDLLHPMSPNRPHEHGINTYPTPRDLGSGG